MTVLAIGGSLPDMLNSIFVARDGKTSKVPSFFHIHVERRSYILDYIDKLPAPLNASYTKACLQRVKKMQKKLVLCKVCDCCSRPF